MLNISKYHKNDEAQTRKAKVNKLAGTGVKVIKFKDKNKSDRGQSYLRSGDQAQQKQAHLIKLGHEYVKVIQPSQTTPAKKV